MMDEQATHDGRFLRIERMLGSEGLCALQKSFVCVVGLGAVGSYATEALARAGVGKLRLVDFDEVRLSNINRQLYALSSTVGQKKCQLARRRIADINPDCRTEALELFVHHDTIDEVLAGPPDLVIDAIDSFTPKLILLEALLTRGIPVVSVMGAARRWDVMSLRVGPMQKVHTCPLAARVRKQLRKKGLPLKFSCVYSVEPVNHLRRDGIDAVEGEGEELFPRGRKRKTLGSLPTLTGIFGLTAANTAIQELLAGNAKG